MSYQFARLIGVSVVLMGVAVTFDLPKNWAVPGQGAVNKSRPSTDKYNVWRGKTLEVPKDGHIEGSIVYVHEVGVGANAKLMARIYLYAAEEDENGEHVVKLVEKYAGELKSRLPSAGKGHGKNRDLNLVFDEEVPDGAGLRRRVLLTASRTPAGGPAAADRTVRLVTTTYRPAVLGPVPLTESKSESACGEDPASDSNTRVEPEPLPMTKASSSLLGCSDYPDDAVLIEETIDEFDVNGEPPPSTWVDYPETEWETWP